MLSRIDARRPIHHRVGPSVQVVFRAAGPPSSVVSSHQARGGPSAIRTMGLTKRYRGVAVVDRVDLTVQPGEIYGFLGPNGAGKTTTMRMLLGLVRPDAGTLALFGRDPRDDLRLALSRVAGIVEEPRLYPYLSGRRNLRLLASLDRSRESRNAVEEVLEIVELRDRADDRLSEYSQGMRQRLGIAACLIRRPRLLLLDEPANGLDPAGIRFLRALLHRLAGEGIAIFLSSHLLAEVQEVCHRVAVVAHGRIVHEGELEELLRGAGRRLRLEAADPRRAARVVASVEGISDVSASEDAVRFAAEHGDRVLLALTAALTEADIAIRGLIPEQLALEQVFFELTERRLHEAPA
jgi:ABC-2 type transport system ATP-binding protein